MANIPFSHDNEIVDLMNRLLDEAAERRRRNPIPFIPFSPIRPKKREPRDDRSPLRSAA